MPQVTPAEEEAFPTLTAAQIARIAPLARERDLAGGENVVLIGSRHSAGTLALQEFLTRNSQPYKYIDVERDEAVQGTLDRFGVGVEDVPVLVCRGTRLLRKPTIEEVADCLGLSEV